MIVSTDTSIGIQCSKCGELQFNTLSAFSFSHFSKKNFYCSCGAPLLTVTNNKRGNFSIEYPCIYCGQSHYILARRGFIWGNEILELACSEKKLPIGYIGPRKEVISSCQEIKNSFVKFASELVKDEGSESEFENFLVVYAVMERLCKLVERDLLGCRCGNSNLAVEILHDRIELICEKCSAVGVINTNNNDILSIIDSMGMIFLEENMSWFINDSYNDQHLVKNK